MTPANSPPSAVHAEALSTGKNPAPSWLRTAQTATSQALTTYLPSIDAEPKRLHQALHHALQAGGKRIRPALVLAAAQDLGAEASAAAPALAAIECLHTYTLIHDDLPAMDDDDLRRGQPTVHRAFDEATAILAGDSLQAHAFALVAPLGAAAVSALSSAAVAVVAGQQDDLDIPRKNLDLLSQTEKEALLMRIHRRKTGALVSCKPTAWGLRR